MEDNVPFQVIEEVLVQDLNEVREEVMPQAQNVLVRIDKATVKVNEAKDLKSLNLELAIVEGIPTVDQTTGEEKLLYAGKKLFPGFMDLCVWANPETRTSNWFKQKQHLLGFKAFCQALEIDLSAVKVNDEFLTGLLGRELLVNIVHQEDTVKDEQGKKHKTGKISTRIAGFKKAA